MNILNSIIGSMSKEEVRAFKLFIGRTNSHENRKDEMLFDLIRKSRKEFDEEKAFKKLYSAEDKNTFYRLKNRLLEDINKSMAIQHLDSDDTALILHFITLSRVYQNKRLFENAFYYLRKAEKYAGKIKDFELLDFIYNEFVKLSHETMLVNPENYIQKRKQNREELNQLQEIDDILAAVIYRLKVSQNFSKQDQVIIKVLEETVNEFANSPKVKTNPKLRLKIYQSVSRILLDRQDYVSLESYLLETYEAFSRERLFDKNNHDTKLQMLTYLVNSLFKNGKFILSLDYTGRLKQAMEEYNGFLKEKYLFYYYNSLVINYSQQEKDRPKALEILEEAKENKVIKELPFYIVFIYLNLAVISFDMKNYRFSIKNLIAMTLHPAYKELDRSFKYKISIVELLIRFELKDYDFIDYRHKILKKEYEDISRTSNIREAKIADIVFEMTVSPENIRKNLALTDAIREFLKLPPGEDIIKYNEWLQSKLPDV